MSLNAVLKFLSFWSFLPPFCCDFLMMSEPATSSSSAASGLAAYTLSSNAASLPAALCTGIST